MADIRERKREGDVGREEEGERVPECGCGSSKKHNGGKTRLIC